MATNPPSSQVKFPTSLSFGAAAFAVATFMGLGTIFFNGLNSGTAATYYLSPHGSDANPCTLSAPCQHLNRFSSGNGITLNPGDIIFFLPGVYRSDPSSNMYPGFEQLTGVSGTSGAPLQVTTSVTNPATITNGLLNGSLTVNAENTNLMYLAGDSYVTISRLNFDGPKDKTGYTTGNEQLGFQAALWHDDTVPDGGHLTFTHLLIQHALENCMKLGNAYNTVVSSKLIDCGEQGLVDQRAF
jgi:hypothetical protein